MNPMIYRLISFGKHAELNQQLLRGEGRDETIDPID